VTTSSQQLSKFALTRRLLTVGVVAGLLLFYLIQIAPSLRRIGGDSVTKDLIEFFLRPTASIAAGPTKVPDR
jgi:hypothetical protein